MTSEPTIDASTDVPPPVRGRDADLTRALLLEAARRRFARDGYGSTTVRDIAADAGVNVALINRYFGSKEGLFEACISRVAEAFARPAEPGTTVERVLQRMIDSASGASNGEQAQMLLLLLRSSGDEHADGIRRSTLEGFARRLAEASGSGPDAVDDHRFLLRAQIAMATALGLVILRSSTGLEPLTSASEEDLAGPLREVLTVLLEPGATGRDR
ncbi:TetR/AcrR family transcriptional regulator [Herbiconiux sp.]|uniref:TetR/AcrR family transcriptional regulator n=1 Tax=Herbiconiux sp. TaxID=1871186 RepID=UPI0025C04FD2|nr:TetR/AcrR family transcriptional regulator [Herbiconiux sp.]